MFNLLVIINLHGADTCIVKSAGLVLRSSVGA